MTESILDRKLVGKLTVEHVLHGVLFLIAIGLCAYHLGVRPYHHDESIHAFYSWKIAREGVSAYRYDPVYHGLILYYSSAAMMALFGDSDFTGRLSAVLFGLGVLAFAWPLRRYLGRPGALVFAALITFSPGWIYFTRFVRHDILSIRCHGHVLFNPNRRRAIPLLRAVLYTTRPSATAMALPARGRPGTTVSTGLLSA